MIIASSMTWFSIIISECYIQLLLYHMITMQYHALNSFPPKSILILILILLNNMHAIQLNLVKFECNLIILSK